MATFGCINEFNPGVEAFSEYVERMEQFFVANAIADDRKRAVFLTVVGPATFGLLRNLLSPATPTSKSLEELIEILNKHYDPVPSEIVERYKFNSRVRRTGESIADYIAELRKLAKYCNYGDSLDMMLRDRIVCGIQDEAIQRKLLSESKLTLARASEIAVSMEAAARDAVDLKRSPVLEVQKLQISKAQKPRKSGFATSAPTSNALRAGKQCFRCGDSKHHSLDCRFKNTTCHSCKKIGHLSKVCLSKNKYSNRPKVNNLTEFESTEATRCQQYTIFHLKNFEESFPPMKIICKVQGQPMNFEVDSGAPFSLIPAAMFEKIKRFCPPLEQTDIKLLSYTNHSIEILGVAMVDVMFNSRTEKLPLLIVNEGNTNLAGRNWISPLKLMTAFDSSMKYEVQNLSRSQLSLDGVLKEYKEMFLPGLGLLKGIQVHLTCKEEAVPKFFKARTVPYAYKEKLDEEIDRLLTEGILEPVKTSEWATPIVPVLKQDRRIRICGDFKLTVNKSTELEQYPLPKIEDLFAQLSGGTTFTKLDLRDAYCQLELDEESRRLLVINTHRGLFRYTRLAFGVASAPAIFQREIEKILQGVKGASVYLDDLLVTGGNEDEHLQNLSEVLSRLRAAGMRLHPDKCEFMKPSVEYLGHRIDQQGLHPVDSKVEAVVGAPDPKNVDELRSFIGLVTYYAKFLPNMATLLAPLYELLKSNTPWKWEAQQKEAFVKIKETLQNSSLLMHFDSEKEVVLACDASPYGLGAVLSHVTPDGDRPVAFASRSLTRAEKNYSHIEKETLALVFGATKFRNYLLGRTFTLLTDHRPLVSLLSENKPVPSVAAARIQRWALTLSAYAYKIKYREGSLHGNADACSRLPLEFKSADPPVPVESVLLIQSLNDSPLTAHLIQKEIERCPDLCKLRSHIQNGWPRKVFQNLKAFWLIRNELTLEENIILRGSRVFVPEKFREFIMDELHSAHQGISAIKSLARSHVWWPGIDRDLEAKVRNCQVCQENASAPPSKQASWLTPEIPWERVHIDHAGPTEGHWLLLVIDAKTKWLEVIPVPSTTSASTIAALRNLFARFGLPKCLVSDNATGFCSAEFTSFLQQNGITHIRTAPYHPQSNGLTERAVRTVKSALKKVKQGIFTERLARFLLNFRNTPSESTGISPAVAMFGHPLRTRLDLLKDFPETKQKPESQQKKSHLHKFGTGTPVWVRSFGRGPRWVPGTVLHPIGTVMCKVKTFEGNWTRHFDQLRKRYVGTSAEVPASEEQVSEFSTDCTVREPVTVSAPLSLSPQVDVSVPPTLSPVNVSVSPTLSQGDVSSPPILSPQMDTQRTDGGFTSVLPPQQDTATNSGFSAVPGIPATPGVPQVRRSSRLKQKRSRLNL